MSDRRCEATGSIRFKMFGNLESQKCISRHNATQKYGHELVPILSFSHSSTISLLLLYHRSRRSLLASLLSFSSESDQFCSRCSCLRLPFLESQIGAFVVTSVLNQRLSTTTWQRILTADDSFVAGDEAMRILGWMLPTQSCQLCFAELQLKPANQVYSFR